MYIPKRYGQSKIEKCPFCENQSTTQNRQGVPVCQKHKDMNLDNMKCMCGEHLDIKTGKFGAYFSCMKCGNINFRKAMEFNTDLKSPVFKMNKGKERKDVMIQKEPQRRKEITVTSDELDFI